MSEQLLLNLVNIFKLDFIKHSILNVTNLFGKQGGKQQWNCWIYVML